MFLHDSLCSNQSDEFCWNCVGIVNAREDERYRVIEQIMAMPSDVSRGEIVDAIMPIQGDVLRRQEPRADLGFGS